MSKRSYRKIRHRADVRVRPAFKALVIAGRDLAELPPDVAEEKRAKWKPTAAELREVSP